MFLNKVRRTVQPSSGATKFFEGKYLICGTSQRRSRVASFPDAAPSL